MFDRKAIWIPRALAIALAAVVSMFAFDVVTEGYGLWRTVGALLVHLVPTFLVLAALLVAWFEERLGGVLFLLLAGAYLWMTEGRASALVLAGPAILIGVLFVLLPRHERRKIART